MKFKLFPVSDSLYTQLRNLPFPSGKAATTELKLSLLSPELNRSCNTKKLVEASSSTGSRRPVQFKMALIGKYPWLMVGDQGAFCIYCKLFCTEGNRPRTPGALTALPFTQRLLMIMYLQLTISQQMRVVCRSSQWLNSSSPI